MVPLPYYLILSAFLFSVGVVGVLIRRNAIVIFMAIELMLNAVNLAFLSFSKFQNDATGHIFVFMVITVAAAEVAIGLAIIVLLFRNMGTINVDEINLLKG